MERNETAPKRRRKIKIIHILILLLLTAVLAFTLFRLSVRIRFQNRIKAIQDAGLPVTLDEMNELYTIPEGVENAADTFIEAFLCYNDWAKEKRESLPLHGPVELPARTEPFALELKELIAQFIADNKQTLEFLHKAAPIEHCRYPVDFTADSGYSPMYHLTDIRNCSILLNLEAILHAENNKSRLAFRSVMTNFSLARSLAKEPTSYSQVIRGVCQGFAASSLEYIINRLEFTDEQLSEFDKVLMDTEDISSVAPGLAGERCRGIYVFKNPSILTEEIVGKTLPAPVFELYSALGLAERDAILYLDFISDYINIEGLPLHQCLSASEIVDDKLRKVSKAHILFHIYSPRYSWSMRFYLRNIAQVRAARAGIAVQRYRLTTGNLPDALEDLVPSYIDAVPKDPYDGRALRYDELETGFVVYSICEDKKDDGGKERPIGKGKKRPSSWDIAFRIEQ